MEHHTRLKIYDTPIARTPMHFGVGVESQLYWDSTNLWDWLKDSGFSFVREFAPDFDMRRVRVTEGTWNFIRTEADFKAWREQIFNDPDKGPINWGNYRFDEEVPWHGTPDGVVERTKAIKVEPMISIGYHPKMFSRPLVIEVEKDAPSNPSCDWQAAASCYEYAFALIWHFASKYGVSWFMTLNEPENQPDCWYLPDELAFCEQGFGASWAKLFRDDANPTGLGQLYLESITPQYAAVCQIVRLALDDVKALLPEQAETMRLVGPSGVVYQPLWEAAAEWLDTLDFHHYGEDPARFDKIYAVPAEAARASGKTVSCSEYNRFSGGMEFDDITFTRRSGICIAELLMKSLSLSSPDDPVFEFLAFYLFHFPSTHRNYKHLLYGDLNFIDSRGLDFKPWSRPDNWYPQPQESQIRHTTRAYHFVRMLTRLVRDGSGRPGPFPILRTGMVNPTSAGPDDIEFQIEPLVVDKGDELVITLLNKGKAAEGFFLDIEQFSERFSDAFVRMTARSEADHLIDRVPREKWSEFRLSLPSDSLTQVILSRLPIKKIGKLEFVEESVTPGQLLSGSRQLELLQTTRLRAIGHAGREVYDLSDLAVVWESSDPHSLPVYQGGLVQRLRDTSEPVTLTACIPGGPSLSLEVAPNGIESGRSLGQERRIAGLAED